MNNALTEQIIKHLFTNLGIINKSQNVKSLIVKEYLLQDKLVFEFDDNTIINSNIWGCEINIKEKKKLKILISDLSLDASFAEYCVIFHLDDCPTYGIVLMESPNQSFTSIACTINGTEWHECNLYLQATFLAGMEKLRDHSFFYKKIDNYQLEYCHLLSFIKYYTSYYEESDEGKKN